MNYYTVLVAANRCIEQRGWKLARCQHRCNGPARFFVFDENDTPMVSAPCWRRSYGLTLGEILACLRDSPEIELAELAGRLLHQLSRPG